MSRTLSAKEKNKIEEEFVKDEADIKAAVSGVKEVKAIQYNNNDEVVKKSQNILLPNGKKLPAYPGRKLKQNINLYVNGKNHVHHAGTLWEHLPHDVKTSVPFEPHMFE